MLPQPLIEEFWGKVEAILEEDRTLPEGQWRKAVSKYRHWVEPKVGEAIYNRNAKDVATTISKTIKEGGFLERNLAQFG